MRLSERLFQTIIRIIMIKYLVLGPAGMGLYAILGSLQHLQDTNKLTYLEEISGASAGALVGFMYCLYKGDMRQISDQALDMDIENKTKINLYSLFKQYGFVDWVEIKKTLYELGEKKTGIKKLTMGELFNYSKIKLHIATFSVTEGRTIYFSTDTHPSLEIVDIVCASMAVPFVFSAVQLQDNLYVDGGLEEVIPATPFLIKKNEHVKAIEVKMNKSTVVKDIMTFSKQILYSLLKNRITFVNVNTTRINLEKYDVLDFKMKDITKMELYVRGYLADG